MKKTFVISVFLGLLFLTACTLQIQAPPAKNTAPPTFGKPWTFTPCATLDVAPAVAEMADCGYVTVPEKRGESGLALGDKTIQLGVVRVKSTAKTPGTPIVVGTGGPGGEGLLLVLTRAYAGGVKVPELYKAVLADRDLVFFTQRGTKSAKPELNCAEFDALSYKAAVAGWSQAEIEAQYLATAKTCADAAVAQGVDLSAYNSNENADDIVDIQQTLGYAKIIYYGQSYGTLLGQFLMRRHPDRLEAVILDGVVPAAIPMYSQVIDVPAAFQRVFAACAANADCNANYPNLAATLDEAVARLKANPASVQVAQTDGTTVTVRIDDIAIMGGLFLKIYQGGADVPATIYQLKANDFATLAAFAPTLGGSTAKLMHFAVNCSDDPNASSDEFHLGDLPATYADYVRDDGMQQVLACQALQVPQLPDSSDAPVVSDLPVLLLNGGLDPATAAHLAHQLEPGLPNSQYVLFPSRGHVQSQFPCATGIMAAFAKQPMTKVDTSCIPPAALFATPFDATAKSEDGKVSISLKLGASYISAGVPGLWQAGKSAVGLRIYPTSTSAEDALKDALAALKLPFEAARMEDGAAILGEPSKVMRGAAMLVGSTYDYEYYVIKHPAGIFVFQFLQGDAALQTSWQQESVPNYLKSVVITQ
ncbi:hypothetical protein BH10CHL1_BH10CHL1_45990 [soil metagenome]